MSATSTLTPEQQDRLNRRFAGRRPMTDKVRNQLVRATLTKAFPGESFQVRNGVNGYVAVSWTDGPTENLTRAIVREALAITCGTRGQTFSVQTRRAASLTATISALVESWQTGTWEYFQHGGVKYSLTNEPHRADIRPYTPDELRFYAAVAAIAKINDATWNAALATDWKRRHDSGHMSEKIALTRTLAQTLMTTGDALRAAADTPAP